MCGFAGEFVPDPRGRVASPPPADRMARALAHRGPDERGRFVSADGRCAIGFQRLSVIDLERSHQPMQSPDGQVTLAFNGEIYNFRALRQELEREGFPFRTRGDTEVLLAMYLRHGLAMLPHLEGMFAFAVHDARDGRVHLVRDRLGVKPLWYGLTRDGRVLFGSEAKALLAHPAAERTVDDEAVVLYLAMGYVPQPRSIWRQLRKLPPATTLTFDTGADPRAAAVRTWWRPPCALEDRSEEQTREEVRARLRSAVEKRLVADVPLGVLLSGGIDSSVVAAMVCDVTGEPGGVRTFSIGFEEAAFDERPHAAAVARHLGTAHREFLVRPDASELLDTLVRQYDEPFGDSSALPTYLLCRAVRQEVTVALGGDGGDEAFAGYDRHRAMYLAEHTGPIKASLITAAGVLADTFAPRDEKNRVRRFARFARGLDAPPALRYLRYREVFPPEMLENLLSDDLLERVDAGLPTAWFTELYESGQCATELQAAQRHDVLTYLPDDLLVKADIASMAHGLELRSPLLDHAVIELGLSLPDERKVDRQHGKRPLREAFADRLPAEVFERPKAGFGVPIDSWLRGPLLGTLRETLLDQRFLDAGWVRRSAVERLIDEHAAGRRDHRHRLWALLWLGRWHALQP